KRRSAIPSWALSAGITPALPTFSAHQRRCAMRFLRVPDDKPSACQRCNSASTCLPFSDVARICRNPASRSWRLARQSTPCRSACVAWLPSRLRRQSWRRLYVRSSIEGSCVSFSESGRLVLLPTRRSEIPEGQGPGAENHRLPRVRRPPYSLWEDRTGRLRETSELIAGDEYLL